MLALLGGAGRQRLGMLSRLKSTANRPFGVLLPGSRGFEIGGIVLYWGTKSSRWIYDRLSELSAALIRNYRKRHFQILPDWRNDRDGSIIRLEVGLKLTCVNGIPGGSQFSASWPIARSAGSHLFAGLIGELWQAGFRRRMGDPSRKARKGGRYDG